VAARHRTTTLMALLAVATLWSACAHRKLPENFQIAVPAAFPPTASAEIPLAIGDVVEVSYFKSYDLDGPYRLGAGDALEIVLRPGNLNEPYRLATNDQVVVVVQGATDAGAYRLESGDQISVVVPTRTDLSYTAIILPDGSVVLPVVGQVQLRGLTVPEAVSALQRRYRRYLDAPQIDLLVTQSVGRELRETVTILPDGSGTVRLLGPVQLRGRTVDEVSADLSKRYEAYISRPKVDVLVTRSNPTVTHRVTLLPDGRVTLPLIGAVSLRGMSVEQASETLTARYSATQSQMVADVLIVEPGGRIDNFFEILAQSPQGPMRDGTVTDDGLLRLPLIPPIEAADRLFADVSAQIGTAYAKLFPELQVNTVFALRRSQRKVTVLGEVVRGGMYDVLQPISVLEALALGGGLTDRAWRSQILLLHPDYRARTLTVRVLDMSKGLTMVDPSLLATTVRAQDIVYVPRNRISDVSLFVQQYITSMIPFNLRVNVLVGGPQPE
jgi:protein involved in polysaccharide export with SLBB domain